MIGFQIRGLEAAQRILGVNLKPVIRTAARAIGEEIRNKLATYPGPVHRPVIWASAKQRRFYFAMRREMIGTEEARAFNKNYAAAYQGRKGRAKVRKGYQIEYTRNSDPMSQRLGPSWTVASQGQTSAVIGTKVGYAPWVQASDRQTAQMEATGWVTDRQAVEAVVHSGVAKRIVEQAIRSALRGR